MNRLTNDKTAQDLKDICEGFESIGKEPAKTHLRYVKLAEYEQTGYEPEEIRDILKSVDAEYERQEGKIKRLAERIELILNDIYNTGRMMQDFDYEAIFKCTRELGGKSFYHREPPKEE